MRAVSLISLSLITGGLLALFGLQNDVPWNPFYAPYPQGKIKKISLRSYGESILKEEYHLTGTNPLSLTYALPAKFPLSENVFLAVTAEILSDKKLESVLSISDGTNISYSAPIHKNEKWQTVTTLFPYPLNNRDFRITFNSKAKLSVREVHVNIRNDARYLRPNCSKTQVMLNGKIGRGFDVNERLNYPKRETTRVVVVGNSTVQGCGAPNGGTFTFALQHKLDRLAPKRFQVMNFGIPGASLLGHIVSVTNYYPLRQEHTPSIDDALYFLHRHPSLKDLKPDYVIISIHWNDLENYISYLSRKYAGHEEDSILADKLLLDETLETFLQFIDNPSLSNKSKYQQIKASLENSPSAENPNRKKLFEKHLRFLLQRYLSRLRLHLPHAKVVMMSLPDLHDKSEEMILESQVQRAIYAETSNRFDLPFIDLSSKGAEFFGENSRSKRFAESHIFDGKIHFSYRGNQWLADQAFPEIAALLRADGKLDL